MTVCDFRTLTSAKLENIRGQAAPNCKVAVEVQARAVVDHIVEAIMQWPDSSAQTSV